MRAKRIGLAISAYHLHSEDQQIYHGIRDYSHKHKNFACVLAPFAAEDLTSAPASNPPYDGILAQATPELVNIAKRVNVPVVDVWFDSRITVPINCVFPDYAKAGRMAAQHLISHGFEHFGYVINRGSQSQTVMCNGKLIQNDSLGFESYITACGFQCSRFMAPRTVYSDHDTWQHWSREIREWLPKQPRPFALFVPSDTLCRLIADIAPELGFNIPHDLGLICADNEPNLCLLSDPSLSSVDLSYRRVGYEAAALLHQLLQTKDTNQKRQIILVEPHSLNPRLSTDATAVKDTMVAHAMRFILDNAGRPINVRSIARHMKTTRRTLERRFRKTLDRTVMQEITRRRIERLKQRLAASDEPIKLLVADSGFNSIRMLYETFVREEGMSPMAYRAKRRPAK
jgi:LacI family transcriptional regulator